MSKYDRYAVIGNPIAHSKSPLLHSAFAEQTQQAIQYTAIRADDDAFIKTADSFFNEGGKGLNVTVPFKQDAFNYAGELTPRAQLAGAVNTLWRDSNGIIHGDTTDGIGLVTDMEKNLGWMLKQQSILVIGAGGAVRGVLQALIEADPKSITLVNRTVEKAEVIATIFKDLYTIDSCGFKALREIYSRKPFDIIINGSSASLSGDLPPLSSDILHKESRCYDMMYSNALTPFLQWAKEQGINQLSDGLGMLVGQGAASFKIWRGIQPDCRPVIEMLRAAL